MDITKTSNEIKSNKIINALTMGYSFFFSVSLFAFLVLKQIMKTGLGIDAKIALPAAAIIASVLLYIFEKKFVFAKNVKNSNSKQIPLLIFRIAVNLGFYKILSFILCDLMKADAMIAFVISVILSYTFNYSFDSIVLFDSRIKAENEKGTRLYKNFFDNRYTVFSALLALGVISVIYMIFKLFPFGDMTVLRMDLYHQYGPMFVELFDRVTQHKSFLYSWQAGGGSSFLGNFFNYLSSPLSALIFLFDRDQIGDAITTLVAVKAMLSAACFTHYLKKSQGAHSFACASFGVFYAFSGYFLAYYWNIMWLDAMILLPIIALGIERIINNGSGKTYLISMVVLFWSNYYMGYMACIFSVVYFLVYFFANYDIYSKRNIIKNKRGLISVFDNRFLSGGVKFSLCSVGAGALCAFFLLPVFNILQNCSATSDKFPETFESYFDILNLLTSHLAGLETTIRSSGDDVLPNVYCGILAVLSMPLYLINKNIKLKEKAAYVLMIIFFVFSFNNNAANFIWHAMHMPNDLPYRFSYMYVFIFLIMAFKGITKLDKIEYKDIMFTGIGALMLIIVMQKFPTNKMSSLTIYLSMLLVMIWTLVLLMIKSKKTSRLVIGISLACLTFSESLIVGCNGLVFTQPQANYIENMQSYGEAVKYIEDKDDGFYRTELTELKTRLDSCLYGYNSMSTFSSMAYENYSQNQYSLGMYGNRINSYTYHPQTPVYNMMYGLKYFIKSNGTDNLSNEYYKYLYTTKDKKETDVYENRYYLPIGFTVSEEIKNWDNSEGNPFEVQESLIDNAAGVSNVFVPVKYTDTDTHSAGCDEISENGVYSISATGTGSIDVTFESQTNSDIYIYISSPAVKNVNYYWDNGDSSAYQSTSEAYIYDLGTHKAGEKIKASLDLSGSDKGGSTLKIFAYSIDNDVLKSAYETLSPGQLEITNHSDTKLEGKINAPYNGYIYTSIPYDSGWSVYVDGEKTEPEALGKGRKDQSDEDTCQLIIPISEGEHTVKLKYAPKGIKSGAAISTVTLLILIAAAAIKKRYDKRALK